MEMKKSFIYVTNQLKSRVTKYLVLVYYPIFLYLAVVVLT